MRGRATRIFTILFLTTMIFSMASCSKLSGPSDADVIKAIEDSGILRSGNFTITSPLVIVKRGDQKKDGSWPVTVKMTMVIKMQDGKILEPRENTTTFRVFKSTDSRGSKVWKAVLGS